MIDPFVYLTPIPLLAVLALLRFVGCDMLFGINPVTRGPITWVQPMEKAEAVNIDYVTTDPSSKEVSAGNLMVVWIWYRSNTQRVADPPSGVTDSASNSYVKAVGPTPGVGMLAGWQQEIWYAKNINSGTNLTVTATFTGAFPAEKRISAHEYSGADGSEPLDKSLGNADSTSNASIVVMTTTARLIFGAAIFQNKGSSGLGFSSRSALGAGGGNVAEDKQVNSGDAVVATFLNNQQDWIAQIVTFK
jgi:hypothetical protein